MGFWTNFLVIVIAMAIGYLVGSIPTGVIIGKVFYHKDPRDYGSHASGGTNTSRTLGKIPGIIVIVLDIAKAVTVFWGTYALVRYVPYIVSLNLFDGGMSAMWAATLACSIGHCWPLYIGFKGGKTVAVYMGATGGFSWAFLAIDLLAFNGFYLLGKKKKIVSYAAMLSSGTILLLVWLFVLLQQVAGINLSLMSWLFGVDPFLVFTYQQGIATTLIYVLLVLRHHENIKRLKNNEEKQYNLIGK